MRKMKDSQINYIGKIPDKWKVGKYKFFSRSRMGETILKNDTDEKGIPIYSATSDDSIFGYLEKPKLILKKGDIVIPARGTIGKATYIYDDVATCTQTTICSYNIKINSKYLYYTILAMNSGWFHSEKTSVPLITVEQLNNVYITVPSKEEQTKIAKFLDKKIDEINSIIVKMKEAIVDYKKYKESIITKAITKGIDEKTEYKNSQIDWIGNIPKEWNIIKIRYLGTLQNGISAGSEKFGAGYPFANYGDVYNNYALPNKLSGLINSNENERKNYSIKRGDIFFTRTSETIEEVGFSCVAERDFKNACFSGFIIRFRPNYKNMLPEFYKYYFRSDIHRKYFVKEINIVTRASLGQDLLKNMPVLIPSIKEQKAIAEYLDNKCKEIDNLIKSQEKLVIELENYKKSLIYEYVTGKKEVKEKNIISSINSRGIKVNCKDNIFAQAILLCKIIEKLHNHNLGRIKAEKTLYLIEKDIGFDFDNNYVREVAGPLSEAIYKCEAVISKNNKWVKVNKVKKHIEYKILSNFNKYNQYYDKYYLGYDDKIEKVIEIIKNCSTDKAEMIATLYASWNDFIIKKEKISNLKIVKDVRENWNDTKKRFDEKRWLDVLEEMKQIGLTPKGNGNLTIIKEQ